jgi:hypothetical protein
MSSIHSTQIVSAPRGKHGYVPHSLHGTTSLKTQLAKRIKWAEKRGKTAFDLMGDAYVKLSDGKWCSWSVARWSK